MQDIEVDRTTRRKGRTRRQLLDAVVSLVLDKGYEPVMIEDITESADVGRRTFYNHFVDKRDCVLSALKDRFSRYAQDMERDIADNGGDDEAQVVATMACRMFRAVATDPITGALAQHPGLLNEAITESQRDFLLANLARGLAANRLQPALPVESLEPVMAWGFVGLVLASIARQSEREDSEVWARFVLNNLGIAEAEIDGLLEVARTSAVSR
ncbi:MAG: TetR/AcrR family transcriptional regulator [Halioglobus sp.]|nr:TetR/AcrR family transcriptional regulator [Halioglobus sp.]